jgi:acylphosphatase
VERSFKVKVLKPLENAILSTTQSGKANVLKARAHLFIFGRVQGVFFRSQTKNKADINGVKGWIRNLPDGGVEAVFEGEKEAVQKLVDFCKQGPFGARVAKIDFEWEPYSGMFENFGIRYF